MRTPNDVWLLLAKEKYPSLNETQLQKLKLNAATDWGFGIETELTNLYDSYVMMRKLYGAEYKS